MKFQKLFILCAAALGGYAFYKARVAITEPDDPSAAGHSVYSDLNGPGSLGQTYSTANTARKSGADFSLFGGGSRSYTHNGGTQPKRGLNQSPPVDEVIENDMPLITYAAKGDDAKVKERLDNGARVDSRDELRRTALMYASANGFDAICLRLLAAGANPEFRDREGNNAFDYAAGRGMTGMITLLLNHSRSSDEHYTEYVQLIQAAISGNSAYMPAGTGKLASINRINPEGQAPLHIAAGNGSSQLIELLIQRGADVNLANSNRQTPLLWAAWNTRADAVQMLIKHGADLSKTDLGGNTPLMMAAMNGSTQTAKILLQAGANKYVSNKQGKNASLIAGDKGFSELSNILK